MAHKLSFFTLLLLTALLSSCAQSTERSAIPPASTATLTRTSAPTLTPTPESTSAPTAIPTLSVNAAHARLLDLLANNGGCRLPCLWGITPGETTYQEAQAILVPLGSISDLVAGFSPNAGSVFPVYAEGDFMLSTTVGVDTKTLFGHQIVNSISFKADESKKMIASNGETVFADFFDSKIFSQRVHPYTLSQVLFDYGKPAAVFISTDGGIEREKNTPGFYILLIYPDQGLLVHYTTYRQLIDGKVRGCPANAHVELDLYPSGDADAFSKSLSKTDWASFADLEPIDNPFWKSIDKATSMSLDQFYETFREPTDKCIETPLKGWYVPER